MCQCDIKYPGHICDDHIGWEHFINHARYETEPRVEDRQRTDTDEDDGERR